MAAFLGLAGSPAHAGIDPNPTFMYGRRKRFPRTRGDRPGWDFTGLMRVRFPRTRGDRPYQNDAIAVYTGVPPHTRG